MKKFIIVMLLLFALPATAWSQAPSNEELYQMIKELERKLDAAIGEASKARVEADKAKKEAAKAKEELERMKAGPAPLPEGISTESLAKVPETKPGFGASLEPVYLRPSRSNLDFVIEDPSTAGTMIGNIRKVDPEYHLGFRAGLSYDLGSGTDLGAKFMWIKSDDTEYASRPGGGELWGTWLYNLPGTIDIDNVTSAIASYVYEQYVVDLGVGQWIDIGKNFGLRIEGGLRYADIDEDFDIIYRDDPPGWRTDIAYDNEFSGWGARIGLGLDWEVGWGFNIFTSVAGSVLVGDFELQLSQVNAPQTPSVSLFLDDNFENRVVPAIETLAGIGYTYQLKNGRSIGAKFGYEWQNWFNMVNIRRSGDDFWPGLLEYDTTDLALDGFFLEAFMNF